LQLLLIGHVLIYIFAARHPALIIAVLLIMLSSASWIAIRPLQYKQPRLYFGSLMAITVGGTLTLALVSQLVINIHPPVVQSVLRGHLQDN